MKEAKATRPPRINVAKADINPYTEARRLWNNNMKGGMRTLAFFQLLSAAGVITTVLSLSFAFSQIQAPKYFAYVVERNPDGDLSFKGMLTEQSVQLNDSMVRNCLKNFIREIRSVSSDPVVVKSSRYESGYLTTDSGRNTLKTYLDGYNAEQMLTDHVTVDLQFDYYTRLGENTWLVHWTDIISKNGITNQKVPMVGQFSYVRGVPKDQAWAENNPWQIYFTGFSITEAAN